MGRRGGELGKYSEEGGREQGKQEPRDFKDSQAGPQLGSSDSTCPCSPWGSLVLYP